MEKIINKIGLILSYGCVAILIIAGVSIFKFFPVIGIIFIACAFIVVREIRKEVRDE